MPGAVVLLMGRSFSGKTTVAAALAEALTAEVLSYDSINSERGFQGGEGIPTKEWLRSNKIAHARAADLLVADAVAVIDDTSSPRFLRDEWRQLASDAGARFVLVFIDVAPKTIESRLEINRTSALRADVTDSVMTTHLDAFGPPAADEPHLRFDETAPLNAVRAAVRAAINR